MDRRVIIIVVVIFFFALLGFLAYNYLEIYQGKKYIAPSPEVSSNLYYAMEMWLRETGHNVRRENNFNMIQLAELTEKVIMVQSTAHRWRNTDEITQWIENGGYFIICLDMANNVLIDSLSGFLSGLGITAEYNQQSANRANRVTEEGAQEITNTETEEARRIFYEEPDYSDNDEERHLDFNSANEDINRAGYPVFYPRVSLKVDNENNFYLMKDSRDIIRLAEINMGKGALTVIGLPVFMYNYNLRREANAGLAWRLTGERTGQDNMGILFVRPQNRTADNQIFGAIFERGNLVPVFISAFLLIIAGFWMVIPSFGILLQEKKSALRPIKDRFTAEIQFLKKHHALFYYLDIYKREQKTDEDAKQKNKYNYRKIINAIKKAQENIYGTRKS